jgi:hypothetical protein
MAHRIGSSLRSAACRRVATGSRARNSWKSAGGGMDGEALPEAPRVTAAHVGRSQTDGTRHLVPRLLDLTPILPQPWHATGSGCRSGHLPLGYELCCGAIHPADRRTPCLCSPNPFASLSCSPGPLPLAPRPPHHRNRSPPRAVVAYQGAHHVPKGATLPPCSRCSVLLGFEGEASAH